MSNILDSIPTDILRSCIFPLLDYHSKTSLNLCLTTKIRTLLDSQKLLEFTLIRSVEILSKGLNKIHSIQDEGRKHVLYDYFKSIIPKNLILTQYNKNFRAAVINRVSDFANPDNQEYIGCDELFKQNLIAVCENILDTLTINYPYKFEIKVPKVEMWSPINNVMPVIVENGVNSLIVKIGVKITYLPYVQKRKYYKKWPRGPRKSRDYYRDKKRDYYD